MKQHLIGSLLLAATMLVLPGCASLFDTIVAINEPVTAEEVSETEYDKCESIGLVVPDPVTGTPMFVLGQHGCDRSSAPAVTVTSTTEFAEVVTTTTEDADGVITTVVAEGVTTTTHEQTPLQAHYNQTTTTTTAPDDTVTEVVELDIDDGHSNCGSFGLSSETSVANTNTNLSKTYGMGLCSQDLAIGIAESLTEDGG